MKFPGFLYHYTVGPKLPVIAASGHLMPIGYGMATSSREKPVLWFSENMQWEPTATKVISTDGGKTYKRPEASELQALMGIYRFRLDTRNPEALGAAGIRLIPWSRITLLAHIDIKDVAAMVSSGMDMGATPVHWWGIMEPLPTSLEVAGILRLEKCTSMDAGTPGSWAPVELARAVSDWESRGLRIKQTKASQTPRARGM